MKPKIQLMGELELFMVHYHGDPSIFCVIWTNISSDKLAKQLSVEEVKGQHRQLQPLSSENIELRMLDNL